MKLIQGFSLPKILLFIPFLLVVLFAFFLVKKNRAMRLSWIFLNINKLLLIFGIKTVPDA